MSLQHKNAPRGEARILRTLQREDALKVLICRQTGKVRSSTHMYD